MSYAIGVVYNEMGLTVQIRAVKTVCYQRACGRVPGKTITGNSGTLLPRAWGEASNQQDGALDDDQIKSLVLSLNNSRRHLTAGQKAMAVAIAYPDAATIKRSGSSKLEELNGIHQGRLANARKILRLTPANAPKVMSASLANPL